MIIINNYLPPHSFFLQWATSSSYKSYHDCQPLHHTTNYQPHNIPKVCTTQHGKKQNVMLASIKTALIFRKSRRHITTAFLIIEYHLFLFSFMKLLMRVGSRLSYTKYKIFFHRSCSSMGNIDLSSLHGHVSGGGGQTISLCLFCWWYRFSLWCLHIVATYKWVVTTPPSSPPPAKK